MGIVERYLLQLNTSKQRFRRSIAFLSVLSLLVVLTVSWNLRQTGIAIANDACCGLEEHRHSEECPTEEKRICGWDTEASTEAPTQVTEETLPESPVEPPEETLPESPGETLPEASAEMSVQLPTETPVEMSADPTEEVHIHSDACYETVWLCGFEEHTHELSCYSDVTADLEDWDTWAAAIPELTGNISEDIVLVAQSQLGIKESERNFELAEDTVTRNGITRYGQWYGNPYGPWSNMFTSFCLRYAGLGDVPINSGAETMRLAWEEQQLYRHAGGYEPVTGDIVFLDKNQNGAPEATAIVVRYFDFVLTVIEGDVDNAVVQQEYRIDNPAILGYGMTNPRGNLIQVMAAAADSTVTVGQRVTYDNNLLTGGGSFILYTTGSDGKYYAIDGNGKAVEIKISSTGAITADVENPNLLYWSFESANNYDNRSAYYIGNGVSGLYLHPNRDAGTAGSLHTGRWETALYNNGNGVRFRGARQDAYALLSGTEFTYAQNQNSGSTFYFGRAPTQVSLWLDGTNGNIMSCRGSDNTRYTVYTGIEMQLPSQWKSPTKYQYKLAGWVNIKTGEYYAPGAKISVSENTVLYADWVAATYDIGQYNADVVDTVSTNDFITTHVFDYSSLINLLSTRVNVTVSSSGHSETWSHVASGNVTYKNQPTLNFSFNDHDTAGTITSLNNLNDPNTYTGGSGVYSNIYNAALGNVLFGLDNLFDPETGEGVVGKHYLGQGDHLFQINTDPTSEYYGYYYYDAKLNAASYNQSDQRFYVYDYLARSSDSENNGDAGMYSDFLPLNSPYANTNGQTINTYNYAGENGEYEDVSHYEYDARYDSDGSAANQIISNFWFGMRVDVQFGLPDTPGVITSNGQYGNQDIYGNDMHFKFTGDDDVWILVDGKVVLDLGGIHQAAEGDINFSTGEVRVNGSRVGSLSGIDPGEHTLSILYLERGSSMSNCAIYFNLAPRFSLTLGKEDVLTQEILNGARFGFYHDQACTQPCDLWPSQQSYKNGDDPTNIFTIENGQAYIWGLSPSRTYYIREENPPNAAGYDPAKGVIRLTLDKNGLNSYSATILEGVDENGNKVPVSNGFTVHGFRIDEENQAAYISITNAQNWVKETTSVYVEKKWNDSEDHTYDSATVYLQVTDPDGTVRRIREIVLSKENDWKYTWTNLPKYLMDPDTGQESDVLVRYSVSEAYVPGYTHSIQVLENGSFTEETWQEATEFKNGEIYVLKTASGCLSAVSTTTDTLCFVDEATAKESPLALWKATVSSGLVRLTNLNGQTLNFMNDRWCFNATNSGSKTNMTPFPPTQGTGITLASCTYHNEWYTETVYMCDLNYGYLNGNGTPLIFHPLVKRASAAEIPLDGYGFAITNTPLTNETSLKVIKQWNHPFEDDTIYEKQQVTIKLLANGVDTGRTETVSLKNNWTVVFNGLPYVDENGEPITYTVVETWDTDDWIPIYGPVTSIGGSTPTYETTVTNTYRWIGSFELPGTGGIGYPIYILSGLILVLAPLVYGLSLRRRYRKEARK